MSVYLHITYKNGETNSIHVSFQKFWRDNFTRLTEELGLEFIWLFGNGYVVIEEGVIDLIREQFGILMNYLNNDPSTLDPHSDFARLKEKIEQSIIPYLEMYKNPDVEEVTIS